MYKKPTVILDRDVAEGVYAASGSDCYTVSAYIHQTPETGRGDYRIQVDARHDAADHNSNKQRLVLSFNQNVEYQGSGGEKVGELTVGNTVTIDYSYWNNHTDNIGAGDVIVTSDPGLAITDAVMYDIGKQY